MSERSELYYHYTGSTGFFGILTKGFLKARVRRGSDEDSSRRLASEFLRKECRRLGSLGLLRSIEDALVRSSPYVVSFSKVRNSPNLWRRYGGDGTGVCLAFEREKLDILNRAGWERLDCKYDPETQTALFEELKDDFLKHGDEAVSRRSHDLLKWQFQFKEQRCRDEKEVRYVFNGTGGAMPESLPFFINGAVSEVLLGERFERELPLPSRGGGAWY